MSAPASYACPRCKQGVPEGASYCPSCARGTVSRDPAGTSSAPSSGFPVGVCAVVGIVLMTFAGMVAVSGFLVLARAAGKGAFQVPRPRRAPPSRPSGQPSPQRPPAPDELPAQEDLSFLATRLPDLERNELEPNRAIQRGGVLIVYRAGCPDCTAKLPIAEKLVAQARKAGLGAHLIVSEGDWAAVDQDKIPESIRDCVLLDARGAVLAGLKQRDMTVLVFDRSGELVYKGSPAEAPSMLSTVASAEGE